MATTLSGWFCTVPSSPFGPNAFMTRGRCFVHLTTSYEAVHMAPHVEPISVHDPQKVLSLTTFLKVTACFTDTYLAFSYCLSLFLALLISPESLVLSWCAYSTMVSFVVFSSRRGSVLILSMIHVSSFWWSITSVKLQLLYFANLSNFSPASFHGWLL